MDVTDLHCTTTPYFSSKVGQTSYVDHGWLHDVGRRGAGVKTSTVGGRVYIEGVQRGVLNSGRAGWFSGCEGWDPWFLQIL